MTLSWTYEGANEQTLKVNDEIITNVKSPHTLNSLDSDTSYSIQVVTKDGDSNVVTIKTKEYVPVTHAIFVAPQINVLANRSTRLNVIVMPDTASNKEVEFITDKGIVSGGYITLDTVGDIAHVTLKSKDNPKATDECKVECVTKDIPVVDIDIRTRDNKVEVGTEVPIITAYNPSETTQRAIRIDSNDTDTITVRNDNGTFRCTGVKEGVAKLTATSLYDTSINHEVEITVEPKTEEVVETDKD